jgi:uncharacterized Fe-S center protein
MTEVFYAPLSPDSEDRERLEAVQAALDSFDLKARISEGDRTAVKTHFGEKHNTTHISPKLIKPVIDKLKDIKAQTFLTETSTLYKGERSNAVDHLTLAQAHGFGFETLGVPIVMADGLLGDSEIEVEIPGELYRRVNITRDAVLCDALVVVSHPTGHILTGIGACIKNLGMGLASRKGKRQQHCMQKPSVIPAECVLCGQCIRWCPEEAIIEKDGKAFILLERCIGCGECLAVCRHDAVETNCDTDSPDIQKRMAEHAFGAVIGKKGKCVYINMLIDMTAECDCMAVKQKRVVPDIGILLSDDPVAVDQATLDLTRERFGTDLGRISQPDLNPDLQLAHAEKIGMGTRSYKLKTIELRPAG